MSDHIKETTDGEQRLHIFCSICVEGFHRSNNPMGRALMTQFRNQHKHTRGTK